jgi:ClpP class serine protease
VSIDPKFLIAGLCLVVVSYLLALTWKLIRLRRLRAATAPRPQAKVAPTMLMAAHESSAVQSGNAKTIAIIHDFGLPYGQQSDERMYLSVREAFEVLAQIRSVGKETPIEIILHTPGGSAFACELIASALKDRPNTTAYVPYCAMSAGTIIALATEKVVMGRYACLGPIDTQYDIFPAESFKRLLKEKPIQNMDDITVLLAYQAEKDLKNARERACELLNKKHSGSDDACQLTDFLVSGDMPHSEQINRERAIQFGVNVAKEDCPDAVYRLVETRLSLLRSADGRGFGPDLKAKPE